MRDPTEYCSRVDRTQPIERRILNALIYIVRTRKQEPKAIYLTVADMALLPPEYRQQINGLPVRLGAHSRMYSAGWWGRAI